MYSEEITPDRAVLNSTPFPLFYAMALGCLLCLVLIFFLPSPYGVMSVFVAAGFGLGCYFSLRWVTVTLDGTTGQGLHVTRLPDRTEEFSFPMRLVTSAEVQAKDVREDEPLLPTDEKWRRPGFRRDYRAALILADGRSFALPQRRGGKDGADEAARKLRVWLSALPPQA